MCIRDRSITNESPVQESQLVLVGLSPAILGENIHFQTLRPVIILLIMAHLPELKHLLGKDIVLEQQLKEYNRVLREGYFGVQFQYHLGQKPLERSMPEESGLHTGL